MLVITRRMGEVFRIGDDVQVVIIKIDKNTIRLGIEAPKDVEIWREELYQKIAKEKATKEKATL